MIKAALWLIQVIGVGNTFTKEQLREAFPGVAQADRRVRDLRAYGWVIHANTEDATLLSEEQRFVKAGVAVWDPAARRAASNRTISNKVIQAVIADDGYLCTACGISACEPYPDDSNQTAVLSVTRRETVLPGGSQEIMLITECKRCKAGDGGLPARADEVLAEIAGLGSEEQRRLARWIQRGRRDNSPLDRAWASYRRLPADARREVSSTLDL